jgi:hypothetical protein
VDGRVVSSDVVRMRNILSTAPQLSISQEAHVIADNKLADQNIEEMPTVILYIYNRLLFRVGQTPIAKTEKGKRFQVF